MCEWLIVRCLSPRHRDNDQDISQMCEWLIVEMPKSKACVGSECLPAIHSCMNELFCFLSQFDRFSVFCPDQIGAARFFCGVKFFFESLTANSNST